MAGNERELGVNITARATTGDAANRAISDLERMALAVKAAGGSLIGLDAQGLRTIETFAGLQKGALAAAQAAEIQAAKFTAAASASGTFASATAQSTTAIRASVEAIDAQSAAFDRAVVARDAAVAAAARSAVRTPMIMMPGAMTEAMVMPNEASIRYRAMRQAEAEAEALTAARASVQSSMSGAAFGAMYATKMGMHNAPNSARDSASVFEERFAQQDHAGRQFEARQEAQGNLATAGLASGARQTSEVAIYATIAALKEEAAALATVAAQASLTTAALAGLTSANAQTSVAATIAVFKEEAASLASIEAQTNLAGAAMANFNRVNSEAAFAGVVAGLKAEAAGLAEVEAQANMTAASIAGAQRFSAESGAYSVIATAQQWERALKTTGHAAEGARTKVESLYNVGSLKTKVRSAELIDEQLVVQADPAAMARRRQDSAAAFGGQVMREGKQPAWWQRTFGVEAKDEVEQPEGGGGGGGGYGSRNAGRRTQNELRHITALFDEGARGQKGQIVGTLGAALRDAGLSAGALATSFGAFVAVMAAAGLVRGAEAMGKWAENVKALATASGMSVESVSAIQGALVLTGSKAEDADRALKKYAQSVSQAMGDGSSKSAKEFKALNISQDDLKAHSGDADGGFRFFVQRLNEAKDSANKAAAANGILGQSFEKLNPAINDGLSGYDQLIARAKELGLTLTHEQGEALIETGKKVTDLAATMTGKGRQAFVSWLPEINAFLDAIKGVGNALGFVITKMGELANAVPKGMAEGFKQSFKASLPEPLQAALMLGQMGGEDKKPPVGPVADPKAGQTFDVPSVAGMTTEKGDIRQALSEARMKAAQATKNAKDLQVNEIKAEIGVFEKTINELKGENKATTPGVGPVVAPDPENAKLIEELQTQLNDKKANLAGAQLRTSQAGAPTATNELKNRIAEAKLAVESLSGTTKDAAISGAEAAIAELERTLSVEKMTAKDRLLAETELANAKIALHRRVLADTQSQQIEDVKTTLKDTDQGQRDSQVSAKFNALASNKPENNFASAKTESLNVLAEGNAAIQKLQEMAAGGDMTAESITKINQAIANIRTDTMQRMIELFNSAGKAAKTSSDIFATAWGDTLSNLDKSMDEFSSEATKAILAPQQELIHAGLTTIKVNLEGSQLRAAAQKIFLSLASDFTSSVMKGLSQVAAQKLFGSAIEPGSGLGSGLAQMLGFGKTAGKAGEFGIKAGAVAGKEGGTAGATAGLSAFTSALAKATTALTGHAGTTQTSTVATSTDAAAKQTSTVATTTNAGVTAANTTGTAVNTGVTAANTTITATDTASTVVHSAATDTDTSGFILHALKVAEDTVAEIIHAALSLIGLEGGGVVPAMEGGGVIPSAANGMMTSPGVGAGLDGKGGRLAMLHPREMVLPKNLSEGVQNMVNYGSGNGGGSNTSSTKLSFSPQINAGKGGMSRAEFSQMLHSQSGLFSGEIRNLQRRGWRP